jgi:hypothetical protein
MVPAPDASHINDDRVTIYLGIETTKWRSSELTAQLGVRPDREWNIGEARGKTGKQWVSNGWELATAVRSEDAENQPASELIPIAMQRFEDRVRPIAGAVRSLGPDAYLTVVIDVLSEITPGIICRHSFLELVSNLGGDLQLDLYGSPASALIES